MPPKKKKKESKTVLVDIAALKKEARAKTEEEQLEEQLGGKREVLKRKLKKEIMEEPEAFGLERPEAPERPPEIEEKELPPKAQEPVIQPLKEPTNYQRIMDLLFKPVVPELKGAKMGTLPIGAGGAGGYFKAAGKTITNPNAAVQAGKAAQVTKRVGGLIKNLKKVGVGIFAAVGGARFLGVDILGNKADEIQQAINTMGQEASTIAGDVKTGHLGPTEGLKEIKRLRNAILEKEAAIKSSWIKRTKLKASGKIYDINADVKDQLDTLTEAEGDILEFKALGMFPELNPYEVNIVLRELEKEGHVKTVQFAPFREELE